MSELEVRLDGLTTIFTINRTHRKNAINPAVANGLRKSFAEFDASSQRVAVIAAAGEHFSGGADLNDPPTLWHAIPTLGIITDKPIICAINGLCTGGAILLPAMSDLCVAGTSASFFYPEGRVGITGGVIATLAGRIPHKFAMELMLLGRRISAQRAYEMGLVNQVVPDGQELDAALEMARDLEGMAPLVLQTLKRFVTEAVLPQSPSERLARAQRELDIVRESEDLAEGIAAFREKRQASFAGQ